MKAKAAAPAMKSMKPAPKTMKAMKRTAALSQQPKKKKTMVKKEAWPSLAQSLAILWPADTKFQAFWHSRSNNEQLDLIQEAMWRAQTAALFGKRQVIRGFIDYPWRDAGTWTFYVDPPTKKLPTVCKILIEKGIIGA